MSMDDDLFNVQDNDEDEEMEDPENNNEFDNIDVAEDEEEEEEDIEEADNDEDEDNDEEMEDVEDNEDEDEDEDEEEENEDEENEEEEEEEEDEVKFMGAGESKDSQAAGSKADLNKEKDGDISTMDDKNDDVVDQQKQISSDKLDSNRAYFEEADSPSNESSNNKVDSDRSEGPLREKVIIKAKETTEFDIIPSVAIPYTSQCHTLAFSDGPRWVLTGGEDGFIRKYDFIASIEGKSPLTMAQRHNLVDSITKAGVISSYWENEQPLTKKELMKVNPKLKISDFSTGSVNYEPKVSPVYALDVERNGYWCLSGVLSGGITLYTMRYNEGAIHHYFMHSKRNKPTGKGHTDAVSVIKLNTEQNKFLSGSWDKTIREWDLNTGKSTNKFGGSSGQISNIQFRPLGLSDLSLSFEKEESNIEDDNKSDIDSLFGDGDNEEDRKTLENEDKTPSKISIDTTKVTNKTYSNDSIFMSSSIDGTINIWDVRTANPVLRLGVSEGTPPWCMSSTWSNCGEYIYAGRRNSTVEEFSIKMPHKRSKSGHNKDTMVPNVSKLLQFPKISGPVSAISTMPNNDFILCGSNDNIRLYNLKFYTDLSNGSTTTKKPATPFMIIPGHHGGVLSSLYVDETGRFMVSASGNRGWGHSTYTDTVLVYEIEFGT